MGSLGHSVVKNPPANAGDTGDVGLIPGLGRSPGVGNGNPLQYTCLENPMGRGAWWTIVWGAANSQTQLTDGAHTSIHMRDAVVIASSSSEDLQIPLI